MNAKLLSLCVLCFATSAFAAESAPDKNSPIGRWTTIDDETGKPKSEVQIFEKDGKLFGRIEKLYLTAEEDHNPKCDKCEGDMKDKPVIGLVILRDLKKDGDEWTGGKVTDPKNGKTYKAKLEVIDGGKKLKLRGFIGFSLLGRTQTWVRAE